MASQSPIIILVRPQMGENIGAVARMMGNFGLSELRIIAPRDGWPNPAADAMAGHALPIIQAARIFPDMPSAMHGITRAYATTARPRDVEKRVVTAEVAVSEILKNSSPPEGGREIAALVFGPERTGLTNEDLSWCETIVTIPTAENSSLNIAQSAVVLGYEWWKRASSGLPQTHAEDTAIPAPLEQYDHLFHQLEGYLDAADFFKVPGKKPGMWRNIRTMLLRGRFTEQEIRTLHGMIRALAERK